MRSAIAIAILIFALGNSAALAAPGDTLWTRTYGGANTMEEAWSLDQTTDGGYIIAGYTFYEFNADFYLVKVDAFGDTQWTRTYEGGDYAFSAQQTLDGGYIIAGTSYSYTTHRDFYLVKTDSYGDTLWTRAYGGNNSDEAHSIQQTTDGGYVVAGFTTDLGNFHSDICLLKIDSSGAPVWLKTYGGLFQDVALSVQQTTDGGYIIAGCTDSFGSGGYDFCVIKTDASGDTLWVRTYGGTLDESAYSVQQTSDGGYIIAGLTYSFGAGAYDFYLVKTDAGGNPQWTRAYGGSNYEVAYSVQQTTDGGYIIAGKTESFGAGQSDFWLVKVKGDDPEINNIVCNPKYPGPSEPCEVSAIITDYYDGWVDYADLYYNPGSGYTTVRMSNMADSFFATIPGQAESTLVHYYISATDNQGATSVSDTMAHFVVDKVASIYLLPMHPPIVVSPGGYFTFIGVLQNDTPVPQAIDVWIMLNVPGFGTYGPINRYDDIPLAPNQVIWSGPVTQNIPIFAPLGDYQYYAICGDYGESGPEVVIDSASFPFAIIPGKISGGATDWTLSGWFGDDMPIEVPGKFSLSNNYPNPFNATTAITYELPMADNVKLEVYNLLGQKVSTLVDGRIEAGHHSVTWDASQYSSGIYFYKLTSADFSQTKRMTIIK